jgi:Putative porin
VARPPTLSRNCNILDALLSQYCHILSAFLLLNNMKINKKQQVTKLAIFAGAAALASLTPQAHAQSSDALIDKLVDKGILTVDEAKDLREQADNDFKTAYQAKTGMPDWVTSYKIGGDFRGRFEQYAAPNNNTYENRVRFRYRLRFGIVANIIDNMEVGFRLASGDAAQGSSGQGNPVSANSTLQNNGTRKNIYIDTAYAKWTAINSGDWLLAATIGKMDNPFNFTWMVIDPDYLPEGGAITGGYTINDQQSIAFAGGAFVLDEEAKSTQDPALYIGQVTLNSKWTPKISSSLGAGVEMVGSPQQLTTANVPYQNQGNTRNASGVLLYNYNPIIGDASVTYLLDSFPLYTGAFPIKVQGEIMENPSVSQNNMGYWVGATFGKSGTKHTWDLTYRYEWLEADAQYDQIVDDDNAAYYQYSPVGAPSGSNGAYGGTNVKGHFVKLNYSITDYLTLSLTGYVNDLINEKLYGNVKEPNSEMIHVMADLMWKF